MRSLSVGAILYVLLIVAVLFCSLSGVSADVRPGITLGVAFDDTGEVVPAELGDELGRYLQSRTAIPIAVSCFAGEDQLYDRLTHAKEVDLAWLSNDFLAGRPIAQLYPLANSHGATSGLLRGSVLARQGMNEELLEQLRSVFMGMHESSSGQLLLARLGVRSFSPPQGPGSIEQTALAEAQGHEADQHTDQAENLLGDEGTSSAGSPPTVAMPVVQDEAMEPVKHQTPAGDPLSSALPGQEKSRKAGKRSALDIDKEAPITLDADSLVYNPEEGSYEARGNVVLNQAGVELKSEELIWQSATQDAAAQGSVQLVDAGSEVSGDSLQYNMATGQGQVRDGRVFVRSGNFHLAGEQIEKRGQADYFVSKGSFTTCDGEVPDWKFTADQVDVTLGGFARAKHVWFHIRDIPVLYTPYLRFPVKSERESGFLIPWLGYSNNKGVRASLAWYQVIDRNLDATIYLDYLSEIGLGTGLEYRYALANQNNGKALYYHVAGFQETPQLYYLMWEHAGKLPGDWRLTADIEYTDKKLFFEEFGEVAEDYNRDKTVSTLMLRRNWQKLNLVGMARYIDDLEDDNDETYQRLPELGLSLARYRLGNTPFYVGLESYATRFWSEGGDGGERLYLRPSLSATFKPGSWLEVVPSIALYERLYNTDSEDGEVFVPEYSLALATRLVKSYDIQSWGIERIQHSIEPKLIYTYLPDEFQDDLPLFDLFDRIGQRNDITYVLTNRLVSRRTAADGSRVYREFFNLRLSQSYNIDENGNDLYREGHDFSDLRFELDFKPSDRVSLEANGLVDVYGNGGFNRVSVGAAIGDGTGNAAKIDYTYVDKDFAGVATDYIRLQLDTPVLKPVYVRFEERYDLRQQHELEKVLGLEYRSKCWSIMLTYRNRYQEDGADDHQFMFAFALAGLGMNKGFGNGFGSVQE